MIAGQCSPTRRSNRMWVARSDWQPCIIRKSEFEVLAPADLTMSHMGLALASNPAKSP